MVLTSNRTREVHDALKRRCLYHWVEHPSLDARDRDRAARLPDVPRALAEQVAAATQRLRTYGLLKPPGVAETLDWTRCLLELGARDLDTEAAASHPRRRAEVPRGRHRVQHDLDRLLAG